MRNFLPFVFGFVVLTGIANPSLASTEPVHQWQSRDHAPGRDSWAGIAGVIAEGRETKDGFSCRFRTIVSVRSGEWRETVHCPMFATARGIDAKGAWREDRSGWVHSLDSPEARKLAVTDRWLNRTGPHFTGQWPAEIKSMPAMTLRHFAYRRIDATPFRGRMVTLWIDAHGLIERTTMQRSFKVVTTIYSRYRPVNGLMLPFRTASRVGTGAQVNVKTVSRYKVLRTISRRSLQRPDDRSGNTHIPARGTRVPLVFSEEGKVLLEAKINGKGPFPFVLDTGGHAILTPATAHTLGLEVSGRSVSYGAGGGSTPLAYAHVHSIRLGKARIDGQTVLVMPLSPMLTERGSKPPVAGILGLEVFERFAVTIDPTDKTIILRPFGAFKPPAGATAVPICFTDDMPLLSATLDARRGLFGLDTGNSGPLMLFPTWAARNRLVRYYGAGVPEQEGGEGGTFTSHMAYIRSLRIKGLSPPGNLLGLLTPHGAGATSNPSESGNLGMTVWRAFRFTLDYRNERLYLTARARYTPPGPPNATGGLIAVKFAPDAFSVIRVTPGGPAAKAGLKAGEKISKIDGVEAKELASLYLMKLIEKSRPGTVLRLTGTKGRTTDVVLASNAAMLRALRPKAH